MNERIRELIKGLNMKQAEFAKRIGVSRPFVSELCSGRKTPSDRTVADICREFHVNEHWLRDGEGEMFLKLDREAVFDIQMLECLLHYHERVTMPVGQNLCKEMGTEKCPERLATDQYAEALREAIRCIRIVHRMA